MRKQESFFALYDYGREIKSGEITILEAEKRSKRDCDKFCKELRKKGIKYIRSSSIQCREYWSFGVPCNMCCKAWLVSWDEDE